MNQHTSLGLEERSCRSVVRVRSLHTENPRSGPLPLQLKNLRYDAWKDLSLPTTLSTAVYLLQMLVYPSSKEFTMKFIILSSSILSLKQLLKHWKPDTS